MGRYAADVVTRTCENFHIDMRGNADHKGSRVASFCSIHPVDRMIEIRMAIDPIDDPVKVDQKTSETSWNPARTGHQTGWKAKSWNTPGSAARSPSNQETIPNVMEPQAANFSTTIRRSWLACCLPSPFSITMLRGSIRMTASRRIRIFYLTNGKDPKSRLP